MQCFLRTSFDFFFHQRPLLPPPKPIATSQGVANVLSKSTLSTLSAPHISLKHVTIYYMSTLTLLYIQSCDFVLSGDAMRRAKSAIRKTRNWFSLMFWWGVFCVNFWCFPTASCHTTPNLPLAPASCRLDVLLLLLCGTLSLLFFNLHFKRNLIHFTVYAFLHSIYWYLPSSPLTWCCWCSLLLLLFSCFLS